MTEYYFFVISSKQKVYSPLNLNRLQFFIDSGRINPKEPITMYHLWRSGAVGGRIKDGVKLLGTVRSTCFVSLFIHMHNGPTVYGDCPCQCK